MTRLQPQIHTGEENAGMDRRRSTRLHPRIHAKEFRIPLRARLPDDDDMLPRVMTRLHPQIHTTEENAGMGRRRSTRLYPRIHVKEFRIPLRARLPDDDDMLREILLRLPPQPSSLPRASAVCRRWRGLVADPRFLRQVRANHGKPPLLGVFSRRDRRPGVAFSPVLGPPDRVPPQRFTLGRSRDGYDLLGCRHGFVLLKNRSRTEFLVCDPVTGQRRRVAVPPDHKTNFFNGAVLCAAGDDVHVHGSPFKLVLMSAYKTYDQPLACVYSSETGVWSDPILTEAPCEVYRKPAVLVGDSLYWLSMGNAILEFGMGDHSLTVIRGPPVTDHILFRNCQIIHSEDGAVGYAMLSSTCLEMWQRNINVHGVATWALWKRIEMHTILRLPSTHEGMPVQVQLLGYDEDDAVFLCYDASVYMVQLNPCSPGNLMKFILPGIAVFLSRVSLHQA